MLFGIGYPLPSELDRLAVAVLGMVQEAGISFWINVALLAWIVGGIWMFFEWLSNQDPPDWMSKP